jgi:4,5-DOPA dioxygenase extradiol
MINLTFMGQQKMPVLFIGHGSPMNIVLDNEFTRALKTAARELPEPEAILVVSAHWLTRGTFITCSETPGQIYDFYGFPEALYRTVYRPPGSPKQAVSVAGGTAGGSIRCDARRGLDHAAWAVLLHMYPGAGIPVMELSLDVDRSAEYHYSLGKELSVLREQGVLVIGSGNVVHNLHVMKYDMNGAPFDWAVEFDAYVRDALLKRRHENLVNYMDGGPSAGLSVPTNDHYLPLLYTAALQEKGEHAAFFHESIQHGSVSMRCLKIA